MRCLLLLLFVFNVESFSLPKAPNLYYFAIGSNMVPSTMKSLRNLSPLSSTAAILPDYELAFNIPCFPLVEPSAASVRYVPDTGGCVHGVLYELSDVDFSALSRSEGVPFAYRWERCQVIPYTGDGQSAGAQRLSLRDTENAVSAFVLMASIFVKAQMDIPPSLSYLQILREGAAYWKMDRDYQDTLTHVPHNTMVSGVSGWLLKVSERFNPQ